MGLNQSKGTGIMDSKKVEEILDNKEYENNPKLIKGIVNFTIKSIINQENGYVESLSHLGWLYHEGIGFEKDTLIAKTCYMKSIELGGGHLSMNNLGFLYHNENNDIENALKWFTRAVESGSNVAAWNLGCLYENTLKDIKTAEFWYKKASDTGHKGAIKKMKEFRKLDKIYIGDDIVNDCFKNNTCNICMDPLLGSSEIIITICGHVYHKACLDKNNGKCSFKCNP